MDKNLLFFDLETRSNVDLKKSTLSKYFQDDEFAIILLSYAYNDGEVIVHECLKENGEYDFPQEFIDLINDKSVKKVIHNSSFDAQALKTIGLVDIDLREIIDTKIQASAHALPKTLSALCKYYNLGEAGKKNGTIVINKFCKKNNKLNRFLTKDDDKLRWREFKEYAKFDVVALREIYKRLPNINYPLGQEYDNWIENELINQRGLCIDTEFVHAAVLSYLEYKKEIEGKFFKLTGFNVTQNKELLKYLQQFFPDLENVQAKTLSSLKHENPTINEVIHIKKLLSNTTPKKYISLYNNTIDNRIKYTLNFMGGSRTGRDSGKIFQPQNLKRPTLFSSAESDREEDILIESYINKIKKKEIKENVSETLSELVRNVIVAPENKKLIVCDLSNIEGRTLCYLAGEDWKLNNFFKVDNGELKYDNYILAYSKAMGVNPETVTKEQRSIGKVMELALGYGGGLNAFSTFCKSFDLNLEVLKNTVLNSLKSFKDKSEYRQTEYKNRYLRNKPIQSLTFDQAIACLYLIEKWRLAHPKIVGLWNGLEECFAHTARTKFPSKYRSIQFLYLNDNLHIVLPSKRHLVYAKAGVRSKGGKEVISYYEESTGDSMVKGFKETYGGKLAENVASALARDVLYNSLRPLREKGYEAVMLVHDEVILEVKDEPHYNIKDVIQIMTADIPWAPYLPLSADGFECYRYKGK